MTSTSRTLIERSLALRRSAAAQALAFAPRRRAYLLLVILVCAAVPTGAEQAAAVGQARYQPQPGTMGWRLLTKRRSISSATRRVRIKVEFGACSGEPGRPRVRRTASSVVVTVPREATEVLAPGVACPTIGYEARFTVALGGRLGQRALRDGSSIPPRLVFKARCRG